MAKMSWVGRTALLTAALLLGGPALAQSSTTTQTFQVRGQPNASVELVTDGCVVSRQRLSGEGLAAALVLALLLESAFALLFNWRVFQIYATGKAWRTPIMLASAWLIVRTFSFDLMAALMAAYYPGTGVKPGHGWQTSLLTAMILAGGSEGVNRLLTTLGYRSHLPKDARKEELKKAGAAWVAVKVTSDAQARVQRTEVSAPANPADIPVLVGLTKTRNPSLREIFFGDPDRVPRSGGFKLDADKFYQLSVVLPDKTVYDLQGTKIATHADAPVYRFAPGAIIDFRVTLSSAPKRLPMKDLYNGFALKRGDDDRKRKYEGRERTPAEIGAGKHIASLRGDLVELGFFLAREKAGESTEMFDRWLEEAVREFQVMARQPTVAHERAEPAGGGNYLSRLASVDVCHDDRYPLSSSSAVDRFAFGVVNQTTRRLIAEWKARRWGNPWVIAEWVVPKAAPEV